MELKINEIKLAIRDKYPITKKYDFGEEIVVFLKGNITKKEVHDNYNGTQDIILSFKAVDYEIRKK